MKPANQITTDKITTDKITWKVGDFAVWHIGPCLPGLVIEIKTKYIIVWWFSLRGAYSYSLTTPLIVNFEKSNDTTSSV